jgi:ribonuclease HI
VASQLQQQLPPTPKRQRLEATAFCIAGTSSNNAINIDSDNNASTSNTNARRRLSIHIMFDGGARGNPGVGGAGAFATVRTTEYTDVPNNTRTPSTISATIKDSETETFRRTLHVRYYVGDHVTNNQAEYQGLVYGLKAAKREAQREAERLPTGTPMPTRLVVQGDSNLIIEQLKGSYACKSPKLIPLYRQAKQHLEFFAKLGPLNLSLEHVYRDHNKVADGTYRTESYTAVSCCRIILVVVWTRVCVLTAAIGGFTFISGAALTHTCARVLSLFWCMCTVYTTDLANEAMDSRRSWLTVSDDEHTDQYDISVLDHPTSTRVEPPRGSRRESLHV